MASTAAVAGGSTAELAAKSETNNKNDAGTRRETFLGRLVPQMVITPPSS
jgi:hypothetical protein